MHSLTSPATAAAASQGWVAAAAAIGHKALAAANAPQSLPLSQARPSAKPAAKPAPNASARVGASVGDAHHYDSSLFDCSSYSTEWPGDGYCDADNNVYPCYDGGDCCPASCEANCDDGDSCAYSCGYEGYNCLYNPTSYSSPPPPSAGAGMQVCGGPQHGAPAACSHGGHRSKGGGEFTWTRGRRRGG
eukprot:335287-Prymnesium_polylepis.1